MTREEILKAYLRDELFVEKGYLKKEQIDSIRYSEKNPNKLIEVIKIAIEGTLKGESETITSKTIHNYLNR